MKYETLLKIYFELAAKRSISVHALAEKYHLSPRTIHRYLEELEKAGLPLYSNRGKNGGFAVVASYRVSAPGVAAEEYSLIVNALEAFRREVESETLDSTLNKIRAAKRGGTELQLKSDRLIIDASPWGDSGGYRGTLAAVQEAIAGNHALAIEYHDRNGSVTERVIEPHALVYKQGLWYALAFCRLRGEFRLFKTGRIASARILGERFTRRDASEIPPLFTSWYSEADCVNAVFAVNRNIMSDVEEWLGIGCVKEGPDGIVAEARLPAGRGLIAKILGFGKDLEVLQPPSLRKEVIAQLNELRERYCADSDGEARRDGAGRQGEILPA